MKKITRDQAEQLMLKYEVVKTNVKKEKNELCVFFTLSNDISFLVKYDVKNYSKNYFMW